MICDRCKRKIGFFEQIFKGYYVYFPNKIICRGCDNKKNG
jgi:hypothetical protein